MFDPVGMENARQVLEDVVYASDPYSRPEGAHAMVLVTEWDMLRGFDIDRVKRCLKEPVVVDLPNVYRPDEMRQHGIKYVSVGR